MFIFLPFLTSNQSNATSRNESSRKFSVETVLPSVLQCGRFKCRRRKAGFSSVWPWPASNYISESRLGPKVDSTNIERTNRAGWTSRQGQSRTIEPVGCICDALCKIPSFLLMPMCILSRVMKMSLLHSWNEYRDLRFVEIRDAQSCIWN